MKIRSEADVDRLDQKIKTELGIDCRKYRNDLAVERFVEILIFIEYVFTNLIIPVIVASFLYVFGFFYLDLVHIEYFIYGFFGLILFLGIGLLIGLLLLTHQMKSDIFNIVDYTIEMMESALKDVKQLNGSVSSNNSTENLKLLFKGMIHIVTIPTFLSVISVKLPLTGFVFRGLIKRIFFLISDRISFKNEKAVSSNSNFLTFESNVQNEKSILSSTVLHFKKSLNIIFAIIRFPIKVILILFFILLFLMFIFL